MKALVLYQSFTGNTEEVTKKISETLTRAGLAPKIVKVTGKTGIELYDYDLIFLGTPVIELLPAKPVLEFACSQLAVHR